MPALVEAQQISSKAAGAGFDWEGVEQVLEKVHEELDELAESRKGGSVEEMEGEIDRRDQQDDRCGDAHVERHRLPQARALLVRIEQQVPRDLALDACSNSERALKFDLSSERFESIGQTGQSRPPTCVRSARAVISNREMEKVILDAE